jgi:hypothetical protein
MVINIYTLLHILHCYTFYIITHFTLLHILHCYTFYTLLYILNNIKTIIYNICPSTIYIFK